MDIRHNYKSIVLIGFLVVLILGSVYLSYEKYFIHKNFVIETKLSCNPTVESCFKEQCQDGDPRCPVDDIFYFKMVRKWAYVNVALQECGTSSQCQVIYCQNSNAKTYSDYEDCF